MAKKKFLEASKKKRERQTKKLFAKAAEESANLERRLAEERLANEREDDLRAKLEESAAKEHDLNAIIEERTLALSLLSEELSKKF